MMKSTKCLAPVPVVLFALWGIHVVLANGRWMNNKWNFVIVGNLYSLFHTYICNSWFEKGQKEASTKWFFLVRTCSSNLWLLIYQILCWHPCSKLFWYISVHIRCYTAGVHITAVQYSTVVFDILSVNVKQLLVPIWFYVFGWCALSELKLSINDLFVW